MLEQENCKKKQYEEESIEIVKRIETPHSEKEKKEAYETDTTHAIEKVPEVEKAPKVEKIPEVPKTPEVKKVPENQDEQYYNNDEEIYKDYKEKNKPAKKGLKTLFTLTAVGIVGYFGFNALNTSNSNEISQVKKEKEANNTTKKEETFYVEALSVKTEKDEATAIPIVALSSSNSNKSHSSDSNVTPTKEIEKEEETSKEKKPIAKVESVEKIEKKEPEVEEEVKEEPKPISKIESVERVPKSETRNIQYEKIKPRFTRVRSGDTLASISKRFYGNSMEFKRIIRANPRIRNKNTSLRLGEKIIVPRKDNKRTRRFVIVKRGNTLASIAKSVYGTTDKISKIVRGNYKIKSKYSTLRLGQKLYVPR